MTPTDPLSPETQIRAAAGPDKVPEETSSIVVGAGIDWTDPNSPLAPYYLRISGIVAVVFLIGIFSLLTQIMRVWHTDVWGHVRFGEEIVRHFPHLPEHEPFPESFADKERLYVHFQWIAQASLYLAFVAGRSLAPPEPEYQLGGGALMLGTLHTLVITLRLALMLFAFRRLTGSTPFAIVGTILVFALGMTVHLGVLRPQIFGELGFAAVLLALSRPVLSRRAVVLLPLVFLLWVNAHSTVVMGIALLGIAFVGRLIEVAWPRDDTDQFSPRQRWAWLLAPLRHPLTVARTAWHDVAARRLALALVLSLAATMVNPHGPMLWRYSWEMSQNPNIGPFMEEWKPIPIRSLVGHAFLVSMLVTAVVARCSPQRWSPAQVLLLALFGWQSLAHARIMVWWCMVFPWVVLPHLEACYRRYLPPWLEDHSLASFRKTMVSVLLGVIALMWSLPAWWLLSGEAPPGRERVHERTPVQASRYIRQRYAADTEGRLGRGVFASETTGDYLLWDLRLDPPIRLACYSHVHLFPPEHWKKCYVVKSGGQGWQQILDEWDVEFIVVEYDLYEQGEHAASGRPPGIFNLIDKVKASGKWRVAMMDDPGTGKKVPLDKPVFVAERIRE